MYNIQEFILIQKRIRARFYIMKIKIKSKEFNNKYIYADLIDDKKSDTLMIFLSGFSGSSELPLLTQASREFSKNNFSTLRLNFCSDPDDSLTQKNALKLEDMDFSLYIIELKNVIDQLPIKYDKIVFVGHSFGAIISTLFLNKYKSFLKNCQLILWEPSLLPWKIEWMEQDFLYDPKKDVYTYKNTGEKINKRFYSELIRVDSVTVFQSLKQKTYIVAAKGSADKDAKKYISKTTQGSKVFILKNTDHCFKGKDTKKDLFKKTLEFINN